MHARPVVRARQCSHPFFYTCTCAQIRVHAPINSKKTKIWIPRIATHFHRFSTTIRAICAPELCNLAHTQSPLLEYIKHNQWSSNSVDTFKHKFSLQEEIILNRCRGL